MARNRTVLVAATTTPATATTMATMYPIGTVIRRYSLDTSSFQEGEVTLYNDWCNLYEIDYSFGGREKFIYGEI